MGLHKSEAVRQAEEAAKKLEAATQIDEKENTPQNSKITTKLNKVDSDLIGDIDTGNISATVHANTSNEDTMDSLGALAAAVSIKMRQDEKDKVADTTMSSVPASAYESHGSNVKVTASDDSRAYKGPLSQREREDLLQRINAKTATDDDMRRIDESMIMDLPFIKAADYTISTEFNPRPKDPAIRFRWVNYINWVQGNMMRLMADGFEVASIDDVDLEKTPIHEKMIEGTQIKQYDVILMKISVLRLMALYRRNIETAAFKLDGVTSGNHAQAAAQQSFSDSIMFDPTIRGGYNRTKVASGKEPVTFSRT